ncbi:acetolactate synthase-1/2/3 large subunit [Cribrihabitans marinus]|uniref:Acetolactate synthase-1/2/3 large subunit n=1 Tax=Cribrihabitans marinus TaxID=1227549 RepID=A0A1H6R9I3_9RHOB|nr:5-guanidino-2-oxopentanoate decarboxylase [Cribrihabitans marinus]GGH20744.1 hypothetical protein GCM10010973_04920 [Cribrihabitans marinus]SEI52489.1 acetolactate synthase-1/2/3 large subunit [Cribrihabitans marinus]
MTRIGEGLVQALRARGVDLVFGIPGVHTIELYRGLAASGIRHVTPRHEQGAGFMADGYARVTGRPGVALVITGPGLTNTLTPMAQARADSVPMLVLSGVNARASLGKGLGHLHELPDQLGLSAGVALRALQVDRAEALAPALDAAFDLFASERPGPVHVEIPLDVAPLPLATPTDPAPAAGASGPDPSDVADIAARLKRARRPVILAGGGVRRAGDALRAVAERCDAPVVQTVNARGLMHAHPLGVPASPSLRAVRDLIEGADLVLALGTELGPTDYDMYGLGGLPDLPALLRVDLSAAQLARHPAELAIRADAGSVLTALRADLGDGTADTDDGPGRAEAARAGAWQEIGPAMRALCRHLAAAREAMPGAVMVGDSTQLTYAGNLYHDHDRPGGWFNSATGFGALGYAIPAAIGAALGAPETPVLCLAGDGGAQFTLPELMVAVQERLPITFVIWNNRGYGEIETSMRDAGVAVVGCDPEPPDFQAIAKACRMLFTRIEADPEAFAAALRADAPPDGPRMIEIDATGFAASF